MRFTYTNLLKSLLKHIHATATTANARRKHKGIINDHTTLQSKASFRRREL